MNVIAVKAFAKRQVRTRFAVLCIAPLLMIASSDTRSAAFSLSSDSGQQIYYSGPVYATFLDARSGMFARALTYSSATSYMAPYFWYLNGSTPTVRYRVPHRPPSGYYEYPGRGLRPTPQESCSALAGIYGATLTSVQLTGGIADGRKQWQCRGPYINDPSFTWSATLLPKCDAPFAETRNDDPMGEYMCGYPMLADVGVTDAGPDRPDDCPAEGNPILPNSAQKVEYDVEYDNGRLLRFRRSYGSLREGIGASHAMTHSFSAAFPNGQASPINRRSDGTRLFAAYHPGLGWYSQSADTPYRISSSGSYPNQTFHIVSFSSPMSEQYDTAGRLAWRSHAHGVIHQLTYANGAGGFLAGGPACVLPAGVSPPTQLAPLGALQCVTDSYGRQLNFFVDGSARITKLIDPAGQAIDYAYDEASSYIAPGMQPGNNLTSVRYPDGYVRQYHYNEPQHTTGANFAKALTGISELVPPATNFARFSTFGYDAQGRAVLTERTSAIMRHSLSYASNQVAVTDPLGTVRTHTFSSVVQAQRRTSTQQPAGSGSSACSDTLSYDTSANITSRVDFKGNQICYAYNTARRLETKRVEGLSSSSLCSTVLISPPANTKVISTEWHSYWRLRTRLSEPKRITTIAYNDNGATCAPTGALVDGRPIAVVCSRTEQATTDETGATGFAATVTGTPRIWRYTYTTYGRILTATDPNNRVTTYTYYADNDPDVGRRGSVATVTNAANQVTSITDYNPHGQPTRIVDPNGVVTVLTYDLRLRLTGVAQGGEATIYRYDPRGPLAQATLPDGSSLTYTHDAAHRLTAINDHKGNRIEYTLDAMGNRLTEKVKDPGGALAKNVARVIDALNRIQQVTGAIQ